VKTIFVPAPPKSAYNPNRRVSDLLMGQLKHFHHLELKNGIKIDPVLPRDVWTEAGAARYITAMTRAIRAQSAAAQGIAMVPAKKRAAKAKTYKAPDSGLAIAAGSVSSATGKKAAKKAAKKSGGRGKS